ncbi:hypothetical protein E2C01_010758 [Portunus trituberculatus]|uniref:Uncharacterized protein n=1 Tax=Portunus trituberculatus TaxID=210409 RepID=A0A5B7D9A1_PORTR|nr:hypothetical protein [Portunus trituberculatus]
MDLLQSSHISKCPEGLCWAPTPVLSRVNSFSSEAGRGTSLGRGIEGQQPVPSIFPPAASDVTASVCFASVQCGPLLWTSTNKEAVDEMFCPGGVRQYNIFELYNVKLPGKCQCLTST